MLRSGRVFVVASALTISAGVAHGLGEKMEAATQRGLDKAHAFTTGGIDHVNLSNGSLSLTIPIGPSYAVGEKLQYQFVLIQTSQAWDYWDGLGIERPNNNPPTRELGVSFPQRDSNAGLGWRLSLGDLVPPSGIDRNAYVEPNNPGFDPPAGDNDNWAYVGPDGSSHDFWPTLHPGAGATADPGIQYSNDGSYLRLRAVGDAQIVESADGVQRIFRCPDAGVGRRCWRLDEIRDRSGNWVRINYDTAGKWLVSDSVRGANNGPAHIEITLSTAPSVTGPWYPRGIVTAFKARTFVSATNATWAETTFQHALTTMQRRCHPIFSWAYRFIDSGSFGAIVDDAIELPILTGITQPDGSTYGFGYRDQLNADHEGCVEENGRLESSDLPTGARLEWDFGRYISPRAAENEGIDSGDFGGDAARVALTDGVYEKRLVCPGCGPNGSNLTERWRYRPSLTGEVIDIENQPCLSEQDGSRTCVLLHVPRVSSTTVLGPDNLASVSYFSVFKEDNFWDSSFVPPGGPPWFDKNRLAARYGWIDRGYGIELAETQGGIADPPVPGWEDYEYGLPVNRYKRTSGIDGQELYASTESYACPDGHDIDAGRTCKDANDVPQNPTTYCANDSECLDGFTCQPQQSPFTPPTVAGCKLVRAEYVAYQADPLNEGFGDCFEGNLIRPCAESNRRLVGSKIITFKNLNGSDVHKWRAAKHEELDGVGHFRRSRTSGTYRDGNNVESFVHYNPDSTGPLWSPASIADWILDTADESSHEEGQTVKVETVYDAAGLLASVRRYRSFGTASGATDVRTDYVRDGNGRVTDLEFHGGDRSSLTAGPEFWQKIDYEHGVPSTIRWVEPARNGQPTVLRTQQNAIDVWTGLVRTSTDPSEVVTSFGYDELGRLTLESSPLGTTTYSYCTATKPGCAGNSVAVQTKDSAGVEVAWTKMLYDALGRLVETQKRVATGAGTTGIAKQRFAYDLAGRRTRETVVESSPDENGERATVWTYDTLGRVTSITAPDDSVTTTTYEGDWEVTQSGTVAGEDGDLTSSRTQVLDALGRIVEVTESSGGSGGKVSTSYGYDANGKIASVTINDQQIRSFTYDALGRLRSSITPEVSGSELHQRIDTQGNIGQIQSAGRTLMFGFDAASRPISVFDATVGSLSRGMISETVYGSSNRNVDGKVDHRTGKPILVKRHNRQPVDPALLPGDPAYATTDVVVTETFAYLHDAGLQTDHATRIAELRPRRFHTREGLRVDSKLGYDAHGGLETIGYPECAAMACPGGALPARTVKRVHQYDTVVTVKQGTQALADFAYHLNGLTASIAHWNGTTQTLTVDTTGISRPRQIRTLIGQQEIWSSGPLAYDGVGNVKTAGSDWYRYDKVSRIRQAHVAARDQSFTYDAYGNVRSITTDGAAVTYDVDPDTNRLTEGTGVGYDPAGNVTTWQGKSLRYDALNMPGVLRNEGFGRAYVYDSQSHRIGDHDYESGLETWTLRFENKPLRELTRDGAGALAWKRDSVGLGGTILTTYEQAQGGVARKVYHLDHLGSTRLVTGEGGVVAARWDYFPFGGYASRTDDPGPSSTLRFTGHERDHNEDGDADDLDYMLARYYTPFAARFLSVDPASAQPGSPQSWNRYAYVSNNPVNATDPTGTQQQQKFRQTAAVSAPQDPCRGEAGEDLCNTSVLKELADNLMSKRGWKMGGQGVAAELDGALTFGILEKVGVYSKDSLPGATALQLTGTGLLIVATGGAGMIKAGAQKAGGAAAVEVTEELAARAAQVHEVLDPIAQTKRTTAILRTTGGDIVAGGVRDLSPAQRALLNEGEVAAKLAGEHAEVTALHHAAEAGLQPKALAATWNICPRCAAAIEAAGGVLTSAKTAIWP